MRARRIEFLQQGGLWHPKDLEHFQRVDRFCKEEMANKPTLAHYLGAWGVENEDKEVLAVGAWRLIPDIHIRVKHHRDSEEAMKTLVGRMNDHLADNGFHGSDVLIYKAANETPEQACPRWEQWLSYYGAMPADRYIVSVK